MTTRLKGFLVALESDMREDDAESIRQAIRQLRGVLDVEPVESTPDDWIMARRIRSELIGKLYNALQ